jgi:threonine aldolase
MRRRNFLAAGAMLGSAPALAPAGTEGGVSAIGDGIALSAAEYASLLDRLAKEGRLERDTYSIGGSVAALEKKFAELLGKESAIWMPTGTLANHLAVRTLAGEKRRVLVQQESHLYNDSGDCAQTLSNLNLVPLAAGKAAFSLEDVESQMARTLSGRVSSPIGAIQIETPVRRKSGQRFDFAEMKRISKYAREHKIGLHLDGARLLLESAYTGNAPAEYARLFDTVYISLYKYLNAASGAILAGPKALLEPLVHTRRMFGGGLNHVWPFAAVALHYLDGFALRYQTAVKTSEEVIATLEKDSNFEIERIERGTNIFRFRVRGVNAAIYQQRLEDAGVRARTPDSGEWYQMQVNETWNRRGAREIIAAFRKALG